MKKIILVLSNRAYNAIKTAFRLKMLSSGKAGTLDYFINVLVESIDDDKKELKISLDGEQS